MSRLLRSLYSFYLNHFFVNLVITIISAGLYREFGNAALSMICWFKIITASIFCFSVNANKKKEFVYYQNLGISKQLLWAGTIAVDLLVFIILMILSKK